MRARPPLSALFLVAIPIFLAGCASPCNCLVPLPDGDLVDFEAQRDAISAFVAGPTTGVITDQPGDEREGVHFETCAIASQFFSMTLDAGDPTCGIPHDVDEAGDTGVAADCSEAQVATWPLSGTLALSDASEAVEGTLRLESWEQGLLPTLELGFPAADYPHQTVDIVGTSETLDGALFSTLTWSRRLSQEDDALTVWEVCLLTRMEGDPL